MMFSISTEAKVGLFVLVALIILGYMSFRVGEYGFGLKKGYLVSVTFDNVAGLEKDASVTIAGVEVGRVDSIGLKNGQALVTLRIIPEVKLEDDVKASIKTHGILGDKFIEIEPGSKGRSYIESGGEIARVEQQADLDKILRDLSTIASDVMHVTASLRKVVGGDEGVANLRAIIQNTRELSENLNKVVKQNDEKFTIMVGSLQNASAEMEKTFAALSNITERIDAGEGTIGQLVNNEGVFEKLDHTVASLQEITDKINRGEGSIGKLVNEDETVDNLNASLKSLDESMEGINGFVRRSERYRLFLNYTGEYRFDTSDSKGYFELKIQPNEDKFYIIGLANDPRGKLSVTDTTVNGVTTRTEVRDKDEFTFYAEIGKRYKDLVVRGGIIESSGGIGVDYFMLDDDLKMTFEAYDFDPDRDPHLRLLAEYRLFKHIYVSAGWDDFMSDEGNSSPFAGVSVRFEDDDLKYLLTSAPIPK